MEEIALTSTSGHPVSVVASIPASARTCLIMSHGFTSNMQGPFYKAVERELNQVGIGTLRYEYYGHGSLYGFRSNYGVTPDVTLTKAVASLDAVVSYARSLGVAIIGLLGSSFGGLVSLVYASSEPGIRVLVLKSPVSDPVSFWKSRLGDQGIASWEREGQISYGEGPAQYRLNVEFWRDLQKFDPLGIAQRISCPTLIVHGDKDTVVPIEQSRSLARRIRSQFHVVSGAGHAYDGDGQIEEVKAVALDFLGTHLTEK